MLFPQNNIPIYAAKITRVWLCYNFLKTMNCSACSADLCHIENLCGAMVWEVYKEGRKNNSVCNLKFAVVEALENISPTMHEKYALLMPSRCIEVVQKFGAE